MIISLFYNYNIETKMSEFEKKRKTLFPSKQGKKVTATQNAFAKAGLKESNKTTSGNGAKKYSTSNDAFVDQFAAIGTYKEPRKYEDISKDVYRLWSINPLNCLKFNTYIRMITRDTQVNVPGKEQETLEGQKGQGLKHEGIMRMMWLAIHHKPTFEANFPYFIAAGSWKDVFTMMALDIEHHGIKRKRLDWDFFKNVILAGLANENTSELVKKYLPTIKSAKECTTIEAESRSYIGKFIAKAIYGEPKEADDYSYQRRYRRMKNSGTAHKWQQLISQKKLLEIDFSTIHGRALSLLVGSKFLKNQGLEEKYLSWIGTRKTAKYTGFVHELFAPFGGSHYSQRIPDYQELTINAQFNELIEKARGNEELNTDLLVVRDISGSMTSNAVGTSMTALTVGKAMALYFSSLLTGAFANCYAVFSEKCELRQWTGTTAVEKWKNDNENYYCRNTNLQSVAEFLVRVKNVQGIAEGEFPKGCLIISDGEFDSVGTNTTNFEAFRVLLLRGGFSEEFVKNFKLIIWDIYTGHYGKNPKAKFEDFADAPNTFYLSGYDPSAVAFILGTKKFKPAPKNATELFQAAMDQDLLNRLTVEKDLPKVPKFVKKKVVEKPKKVNK